MKIFNSEPLFRSPWYVVFIFFCRVQKEELPALEYVMRNRVERVNVGVMMAGQGRVSDVFNATASFMKERKRKEEEALRAKRKYSPAQEEARRCVLGCSDVDTADRT